MKKALVILLAFLILTNFHCARLNVQTVNSDNILAACRATLLENSEDSVFQQNGTLVLTKKFLYFEHKGRTKKIPYSQINSLDVLEKGKSRIPKAVSPSFTKKKSSSPALPVGVLAIAFLAVSLMLFLFGIWDCPHLWDTMIAVHFNHGEGSDMAAFRMSKEDLARIYPILEEKIH